MYYLCLYGNVVMFVLIVCWIHLLATFAGNHKNSLHYSNVKGTHTIYFSSSLYIINQKPMIPRIYFHCITTWVAPSSG